MDDESTPTDAPQEEPTAVGPPFHHTRESVYVYDGTEPTMHRVLGLIEPGENQWTTDELVVVEALESCCAEGLLRQMAPGEGIHEAPDETAEGEPA